jgi:hypothetical protein
MAGKGTLAGVVISVFNLIWRQNSKNIKISISEDSLEERRGLAMQSTAHWDQILVLLVFQIPNFSHAASRSETGK